MRRLKVLALAGVLMTSLSSASAQSSGTSKRTSFISGLKNEAVSITLDPQWTLANKVERNNTLILQFVPAGADVKDPHILLNVVSYVGAQKQTNAKKFVDTEIVKAPEFAKPGKLETKILESKNPNDITYQLSLTGNPKFPDQFEVHRVISGKDAVHTIIYHVRPAKQAESKINEMIEVVRSIQLVDLPKRESAGK